MAMFHLDKMLLIQHRSENVYYMESKSTTKYSEQYMKLCEISPIEDETEILPIQFLIFLWRYTAAVCIGKFHYSLPKM